MATTAVKNIPGQAYWKQRQRDLSVAIQTCAVEEGWCSFNKHFRPTMIDVACLHKAKEHTFMFELTQCMHVS